MSSEEDKVLEEYKVSENMVIQVVESKPLNHKEQFVQYLNCISSAGNVYQGHIELCDGLLEEFGGFIKDVIELLKEHKQEFKNPSMCDELIKKIISL